MVISYISIAIAILFGITTIYLYLRQVERKEPLWTYQTVKIIGLGSDAPKELEVTFNKEPVSEVFRTLFIFFNKGKKAIRQEDIAKDIRVQFRNAKILRKPNIISISKPDIEFSANKITDTDDTLGIKFLFLGHNDGAIIEVVHSGKAYINCTGSIPDADIKTAVDYDPSKPRPPKIIRPILLFLVILGYILTIGIMTAMGNELTQDVTVFGSLFAFLFLLQLIDDIRKHISYRKLPLWTRKVPFKLTSLFQETQGDLEAYCVKCRVRTPMVNPKAITMRNGRPAVMGNCSTCGTRMFKIGK